MNNFTVIIPTNNRHSYLKRSIEYWKNLDVKVIYCDSSIEPYNNRLPSNIEYRYFPNTSFCEKILKTLDMMNTSYVALCADDDFIMLETLFKGCDILNRNKNIATIHGNTIEFLKDFDCNFYINHSFIEENLIGSTEQKVIKLFSDYRQILWGLYKTEIIRDAFEIINIANFKNDNFFEMVIGVIAAHKGDIRFLEDVWSVREYSQDSHWATRHKGLYYYKQDKDIQRDIRTYTYLVNEYTRNGIGELALKNYLKMSFCSRMFFLSKFYLNKIFPYCLMSFLKKKNMKRRYSDKVNAKSFPDLLNIENLLK